MAHPLRKPRWAVGSIIVLALVVLFVNLGLWQLRRLDERQAQNDAVRARTRVFTELTASAWTADEDEIADLENRKVELTGTYDTRREVLVRFQTHEAQPGYDVITPLRTKDGIVLVDRGWVPERLGEEWPAEQAVAPDGELEVVGILAGPDDTAPRLEASEGAPVVVSGVRPGELAETLDLDDVLPLYVKQLSSGTDTFPIANGEPDLSDGPHFSYAVQWFIFAGVVGAGWIVLLRRTAATGGVTEEDEPAPGM